MDNILDYVIVNDVVIIVKNWGNKKGVEKLINVVLWRVSLEMFFEIVLIKC